MHSPERSSRRALLQGWFSGLLLSPFLSPEASAAAFDRLVEANPAGAVRRYQRHLRVHATILLFGVPIIKRTDVGAGCATVETGSAEDQRMIALQFAAGSTPERAHGLNRLGLMKEFVIERDARVNKSSYSGFMTSSPEKSLDQGKRAIESNGDALPCTLASGESVEGETAVSHLHFTVPRATGWTDTARILKKVEGAGDPRVRSEHSPVGPSATFLYAIRRAALDPAPKIRSEFCHEGKLHQLIARKQGSSMNGTILDPSGAKVNEFAVWLDPGDPSGIPNRIEFRARSFLRLTFEADPVATQAQAALPWLIDRQG